MALGAASPPSSAAIRVLSAAGANLRRRSAGLGRADPEISSICSTRVLREPASSRARRRVVILPAICVGQELVDYIFRPT